MTDLEKTDSKKILIVEDDKFLVKVYDTKLKREGYEAIAAFDGDDALDKVKKHAPSLILLDLIIPGMDGFDFLAKVKADPAIEDIPVLILSNLGQEDDIKRGEELGVVDYILKADVSIDEIMEKIKKYLK